MSKQQVRVASLLLQEGFGSLVEEVGTHLLKHGASSLAEIVQATGLKINQVKKCLVVLIQHQLVQFESHTSGRFMVYRISIENVNQRARYPHYIHAAKALFENAGKLICEDLLQQGQSLMSQCIGRVSEKLDSGSAAAPNVGRAVKAMFISMVEGRYLQRVRPPAPEVMVTSHGDEEMGGVVTMPVFARFELPPAVEAIGYSGKKRKRESQEDENTEQPSAKKAKKDTGSADEKPLDEGIYWSINFNRFHQHFHDQALISAVSEKIDETAACVMRSLLNMANDLSGDDWKGIGLSPTLYRGRIWEYLPERPRLTETALDQYLKALSDDQAQFLRRTEDSGGGGYAIDYQHCAKLLCQATVEVIVRERFGSKCLRIFRLLLLKKILEQKQVVDMAMIPGREARELLYSLLAENFVTLQEIPRTMDYAPSRTFYLFSVNLPSLARLLLERTYQALGNLISRRAFEMNDNKRLLEKYEQYKRQQELQSQEAQEELGDMEEVLTPDEMEKAERVMKSIEKLERGELQLDETLMTIANFVRVQSSNK